MVTSQEAGTFIHSGRTGNKWSDHMRSQKSWYLIWSAWTHSELSWQVGNLYIVLKNEESSTDRTGLRAALMKCSDAFNKKMWERKQMVEQRQRYSRKLKLYFLFLFFFSCKGSAGCSFSFLDHINGHAFFCCTRGFPALRWAMSAYLSAGTLSSIYISKWICAQTEAAIVP